jgi:hypothetical protein
VALRVADPADTLPRGCAPVRTIGAEADRRRVVRARRSDSEGKPLGTPLDLGVLHSLGVDVGTLWTGSRLMPSLQRFFEERATRAV